MRSTKQNHGFTIMEVLIFILLFVILSAVVYTVFSTTQNTYAYNSKTVDLRQNLRATVDYLAGELMMAGNPGYDNLFMQKGLAETGIVTAARNTLSYTTDVDMDGVVAQFTFGLAAGSDSDGDGLVDPAVETAALVQVLNAGTEQPISDDIQAVQFAYAVDTNNDNVMDYTDANGDGLMDSTEVIWAYDSDGDGLLDTNSDGTALTTTISIEKIRLVRIWVLGRTSTPLKKFQDSRTYQVGGLVVSGGNDTYKRFLLSTTVRCRNMGL